jgi:hypothetical protein
LYNLNTERRREAMRKYYSRDKEKAIADGILRSKNSNSLRYIYATVCGFTIASKPPVSVSYLVVDGNKVELIELSAIA